MKVGEEMKFRINEWPKEQGSESTKECGVKEWARNAAIVLTPGAIDNDEDAVGN